MITEVDYDKWADIKWPDHTSHSIDDFLRERYKRLFDIMGVRNDIYI